MTNQALQDEVLIAAESAKRGPEGSRVQRELTWYRDVKPMLSSNYVIRGVVQAATLALIFGEPGTGKSFFAIDMALCVAAGLPWRNRKVRQGLVLYLAAEAAGSIKRRVEAWRRHHDVADAEFAIRILPLDLLDRASADDILTLCEEVARTVGPIRMIVVDTVSRSMPGGDENSAETMTRYVSHCDRLRSETGAAILLVHHRGKDATRGARGHSSLKAAVDTEIEIAKGCAKITKQRDEPAGLEFPFGLHQVEIGINDEGDAETSCVVTADAGADAPSPAPKLTTRQQGVLNVLAEFIELSGQDIVDGPLAGKRVVALAEAIERAAAIIQLPQPYRRRAEARRVVDALAKHGHLATTETELWIG